MVDQRTTTVSTCPLHATEQLGGQVVKEPASGVRGQGCNSQSCHTSGLTLYSAVSAVKILIFKIHSYNVGQENGWT